MTLLLLQFVSAVLISYSGLVIGLILASLTKEELPTGKKYFHLFQRLAILVPAAVVLDFFNVNILIKIAVYIVILAFITFSFNTAISYIALGVALFAVSESQETFIIMAGLIFLFGILTGSHNFATEVKRKHNLILETKNILVKNIFYPIIPITLFLISVYILK
jgi:hypothetical protein